MRKKSILIIASVLVFSFLAASVVIAKQDTDWDMYACGTITNYRYEPNLSAEILDGIWNLKVKDGKVWFYICNQEKNIDEAVEGGPAGSVDILEYSLIGTPMAMGYVDEDDDEVDDYFFVFGKMQVKKTAAQFDGTYTYKTWITWEEIRILSDGTVQFWRSWVETPWDKMGTVSMQDFF
jgi:hypothetical protein